MDFVDGPSKSVAGSTVGFIHPNEAAIYTELYLSPTRLCNGRNRT